MPIHAHFFRWVILTCIIGATDLVFGLWSGFIKRSVCARLQVCQNSHTTPQSFNKILQNTTFNLFALHAMDGTHIHCVSKKNVTLFTFAKTLLNVIQFQ